MEILKSSPLAKVRADGGFIAWARPSGIHCTCRCRLWHQLTGALLAFVKDPVASRGTNLVELYSNFVESFEAKIDQMALVQIVAEAAKQLDPSPDLPVAEGACAVY